MIKIPTPTPIEIEAVLVDMMGGTNAFGRWVKLGDFHLPFGGEATPRGRHHVVGRRDWSRQHAA